MTHVKPSMTRRGFVTAAGAVVAAVTGAAAVSSRRGCQPVRRRPNGSPSPVVSYIDYEGWMLTADESRTLRARGGGR